MGVALGAFAVLPGLAIGSFLNVVASRLPDDNSIFRLLQENNITHEEKPPSGWVSSREVIGP